MTENNGKTKIPKWIFIVSISLTIAAYGFIINSALGRISQTETDIRDLNPVLLQIQTDISKINTNIEWLREK